jgi:hypothetical protein
MKISPGTCFYSCSCGGRYFAFTLQQSLSDFAQAINPDSRAHSIKDFRQIAGRTLQIARY